MTYRLQRKIFSFWPSLEAMADDLGTSINRLRRQYDNYELPDPEHDPFICQISMARGDRIRMSTLLDARKDRPDLEFKERRRIIEKFVKAAGGYKEVAERTGHTVEYLYVMKNRAFLSKMQRRAFIDLAMEIGFDLDERIFKQMQEVVS